MNGVIILREDMTDAARTELNKLYARYNEVKSEVTKRLEENASWASLAPELKSQKLTTAGIRNHTAPAVADTPGVITSLQDGPLQSWVTRIDALPAQAENALSTLVKELEPKATQLRLPGATIKSEADLEAWINTARLRVVEALEQGPVIL